MKIIFNDATEMQVQSVVEKGNDLEIKTIEGNPETLSYIFCDTNKTKRMIVEERSQQKIYEGFTSWQSSTMFTGGIYGVLICRPENTPEAQAEVQAAAVMVAQIQAQNLTDEEALSVQAIYPTWDGNGVNYAAGFKVLFDSVLYKCLQEHTSQADWMPNAAPSLWTKVLIEDPNIIPEWQQPDSTNGYMTGDKVTHNGVIYESLIDNNIWEPGATGTESLWKVVE